MLFWRNKQASSNSDFFPLTDTLMDFDETMPVDSEYGEMRPRRQSTHLNRPTKRTIPQKWLIASTLIALYFLSHFIFYILGMVQKTTMLMLGGLIAFGMIGFFLTFQTKLNIHFREQRLKLPIIIMAFCYMLVMFYLEPATQIIFTPFAFIAIAYAMYRVRTNTYQSL